MAMALVFVCNILQRQNKKLFLLTYKLKHKKAGSKVPHASALKWLNH